MPSKSLLSKKLRKEGAKYDRGRGGPDGYLPQVVVCEDCNSGFSSDENYLLCVLHAVLAGSLYPEATAHPEAANVLRSNRHIVRALKRASRRQIPLFDNPQPLTLYPDSGRVGRVVLKNAKGHAYHELGEPLLEEPSHIWFGPLMSMSCGDRATFEQIGGGVDVWPEVGSRMTVRVLGELGQAGGWVEVEEGRYRYAIDWCPASPSARSFGNTLQRKHTGRLTGWALAAEETSAHLSLSGASSIRPISWRSTRVLPSEPVRLQITLGRSFRRIYLQSGTRRRSQAVDEPESTGMAARRARSDRHRSVETSNTMPASSAPGSSATSAAWPQRQDRPGAVVRSTSTA